MGKGFQCPKENFLVDEVGGEHLLYTEGNKLQDPESLSPWAGSLGAKCSALGRGGSSSAKIRVFAELTEKEQESK